MIYGSHFILYSEDAAADRALLRDALGLDAVDAGHDWLIFALPPAEAAVHPGDTSSIELYLMSSDVAGDLAALERKGVRFEPVREERWGTVTTFRLPGGGSVGLYQPRHPVAIAKPS